MKDISIQISNYKSIGDAPQGYDRICPVNLVIGRNNSGKSTLLDLIERLVKKDFNYPQAIWHKGKEPIIYFEAPLKEVNVRSVFRENMSRGGIPGNNHWDYGIFFVGKKLKKILPSHALVNLELSQKLQ